MPRPLPVVLLLLAAPAAADNWPRFRGPTGQGVSTETGLPVKWSATENVAWKVPVPGEGWSSPVVWGDRVFVTTAADGGTSCRVLAFATADGTKRWEVEVFKQKVLNRHNKNSHATPTPATDGERVYAVFNDGGIAAVNAADGSIAWTNRDIPYYSQHGLGNSPLLYHGTLIMPFDGSSPGPDKQVGWQKPWDKAVLLALDAETGKEKWRAGRGQSRIAHATPILTTVGGKDVLVSPAGDVIQGFDPATGERLWTVKAPGEGLVPSPVSDGKLVFATPGWPQQALRAVRLDPAGDPAVRPVAWEFRKQVPMIPSPVHVGGHLFFVTEKGVAVCLDAATGTVKWEERLGGTFSASPVAAEGRIYFLAEDGLTTVIEAKPEFAVAAKNPLGEPCQASMAVAGGRFYVRTKGHLLRIGGK